MARATPGSRTLDAGRASLAGASRRRLAAGRRGGGAGVAPMDPAWVERVYSRGWYPGAPAPRRRRPSSLLPDRAARCLDRAGGAGVALDRRGGVVARAVGHAHAQRSARALARGGGRGLRSSTSVFLACWGLNYRRQPITERLDFDRSRVTGRRSRLPRAGARSAELNRLHQPAHADLATMPTLAAMRVRLAPAFADAQRALGATAAGDGGAPEDLDAVAVLPLGDGGRHGQPARARGDRQPRRAAGRAAVRDRARVGPPGGLGARERGQLRRLAHLSCRRSGRRATADGCRSTGICGATCRAIGCARSTRCLDGRPARRIWRPLPRGCSADSRWCSRRAGAPTTSSSRPIASTPACRSYDEVVTLILGIAPTPTGRPAAATVAEWSPSHCRVPVEAAIARGDHQHICWIRQLAQSNAGMRSVYKVIC